MTKFVFTMLMMFVLLFMVSIVPAFAEPVDLMDSWSIMDMEAGLAVLEYSGAPPGHGSTVTFLILFERFDSIGKILDSISGAEHTLKEPYYDAGGSRSLMTAATFGHNMIPTTWQDSRHGPQRSSPLLC